MKDNSQLEQKTNITTKKMTNIPRRYMMTLNQNSNLQLTKRIKADVWKFFDDENTTCKTLKMLAKNLDSSKQMQKLRYYDRGFRPRNARFKFLCKSLKGLNSLKSILLSFYRHEKITDSELYHFSKSLQRLYSLQNITLFFPRCQGITDETLRHISKSLKRLITLKKLTLNFHENDRITNQGLDCLSKRLKRHHSIESIKLVFSQCGQLTDKALHSLHQCLSGLTSLRNLTLRLMRVLILRILDCILLVKQ